MIIEFVHIFVHIHTCYCTFLSFTGNYPDKYIIEFSIIIILHNRVLHTKVFLKNICFSAFIHERIIPNDLEMP